MRLLILATYFASIMLSGYVCGDTSKEHPKAIAGVSDLVISEADRPLLEKDALKGDAISAFKIYKFEFIRGNIKESLFWAQIAAENNHSGGAYAYAFLLMRQEDLNSKTRAEFWLRKAAAQGDEMAKRELQRLNEIDR